MELREEEGADPWFQDWVLRSPSGAGKHLAASYHTIQGLLKAYERGEIQSCREYFAGIGAQALIAESTFPKVKADHTLLEISPQAIEHLRMESQLRSPYRKLLQVDSYHPSSVAPADLQLVDIGDGTVYKTLEGKPYRGLLDGVFGTYPKAVVLTDIAARYLHLHRPRYEAILGSGSCRDYLTYLQAFAYRLEKLYPGYMFMRGYFDRWSAVLSFIPAREALRYGVWGGIRKLIETPSTPLGLEIL